MDHYGDDDNRRGGRAFWVILLALLAAITVAVVVGLGEGDGEKSASPEPTTDETAPTDRLGATSDPGRSTTDCPELDRSPTELPVVAPDVEWRTKGPFTFPISVETDGESVNGPAHPAFPGTDTCYARTPLGAAFAAASASVEILVYESALPYLQSRVVGPERDGLIEQVSQLGPDDFSFGDLTFRIIAFKIVDFSPGRALIEVVTRGQDSGGVTSTKAGTRELVWQDGDWKVVLGSEVPETRDVIDVEAEGFLTW